MISTIRSALARRRRRDHPEVTLDGPGGMPFALWLQRREDKYFSDVLLGGWAYEALETRLIREHLRPGDVFYDIGANIGYYAVQAARIVGPQGLVVALEPEPVNFGLLRDNLLRNGARNVIARNAALWRENGEVPLFLSEDNQGDHRVGASRSRVAAQHTMTVDLPTLVRQSGRAPDILKLDTQGSEEAILSKYPDLPRDARPRAIFCEFWPFGMAEAGGCAARLLNLFEQERFELFYIPVAGEALVSVTSAELRARLDGDLHPETETYLDLLCVPPSPVG